ncbi:MAG: hypothetical protein R3345_07865 [Fulvivirga sp.]|nr:hypothetical protein [Fulvivirga sp.]
MAKKKTAQEKLNDKVAKNEKRALSDFTEKAKEGVTLSDDGKAIGDSNAARNYLKEKINKPEGKEKLVKKYGLAIPHLRQLAIQADAAAKYLVMDEFAKKQEKKDEKKDEKKSSSKSTKKSSSKSKKSKN